MDGCNSTKSHSDTLEQICVRYESLKSLSVFEFDGLTTPEERETLLEIENLTLKTPSEATLIRDLTLTVKEKDHLLVSILFRYFASLN